MPVYAYEREKTMLGRSASEHVFRIIGDGCTYTSRYSYVKDREELTSGGIYHAGALHTGTYRRRVLLLSAAGRTGTVQRRYPVPRVCREERDFPTGSTVSWCAPSRRSVCCDPARGDEGIPGSYGRDRRLDMKRNTIRFCRRMEPGTDRRRYMIEISMQRRRCIHMMRIIIVKCLLSRKLRSLRK